MDLRNLPTVMTADELVDVAFHKASKESGAGRNVDERKLDGSIKRIKVVEKAIVSRLQNYVEQFPDFDTLDPFYIDLAHVLVDLDRTRKALGAIHWAKRKVKHVCRQALRDIHASGDADEAVAIRKRVYARVSSLLHQVDDDLHHLNDARGDLRRLPTIRMDVPTVVVAGYPNVGKSSFIETVSTGTPTVASYPFTTKGVSLGHVERNRLTYQLVDTPGLLDRPLDERNDIERQAIVALDHVAHAILFVLDPSGTCGYPLEAQEHLLQEIRSAFPDIPLLAVDNKADIHTADTGRPRMSLETGDGVDDILEATLDLVETDDAWV